MTRTLLAVALAAAASLALPAVRAHAQTMDTPIRKGEFVTFSLDDGDGCDPDEYDCPKPYIRGFVYRVRKGEQFAVSMTGPSGAWRVVTSTDASIDDLGPCATTMKFNEIATCTSTEPASRDYDLAIAVGSDRPVGEFRIGVYDRSGGTAAFERDVEDHVRGSSIVNGLNVSAGFTGRSVLTDDADERHNVEGWILQWGFGIGERVHVFGEYEDAIGDVGEGDASFGEGLYGISGYAGGLRLYMTGRRSQFRPYVQGSFGMMEREAASGAAVFEGSAIGAELGVRFFLGRLFSFDFAATGNRNSYGKASVDGESIDLGDEKFGETGFGGRIGATFNLFGG